MHHLSAPAVAATRFRWLFTLAVFCALGWLAPGQAQAAGPTWTAVDAPMAPARGAHTATPLPNGLVLLAGGGNSSGALRSAVLYHPDTRTWSATANDMATPRRSHTATLLSNGQVLVAGGVGSSTTLNSAELYDPATNTWSTTGTLNSSRQGHTATLLPNGKVLVTGGVGGDPIGYLATAELYDPATNTWSATGSMATEHLRHTATLLPSGQVLVAGGQARKLVDGIFYTYDLDSAELYDPASNTWSEMTGKLLKARNYHVTTLLPNGQVLVAGGMVSEGVIRYLDSAELYDPATDTWTATGNLTSRRASHTMTVLPNGQVLLAGGDNGSNSLTNAMLYNPNTGTWSDGGGLGTTRLNHTATLLQTGEVLVAGGLNGTLGNNYLDSAALYTPATITVTASSPTRGATLGGTAVTITGGNFTGATSVTVCGAALTGFTVTDDTSITGTTLAHAATSTPCDVVVTTGAGTGTGTALFSYVKSDHTLGFGPAPVLVAGGATGTVSATSSVAALNGLTTYTTTTSTVCTISANTVTAVAAGICTVAADNPGNGDYSAAQQVTQNITVAPAPLRSVTGTPAGASGAITASFTTPNGSATCGYESTQFPAAAAVGGTLPAGFDFAQGGFGFVTTQCGSGAMLTITLTLAQPVPAGAKLFKFNGNDWVVFPASISGNTVTYTVTDGGAGDSNPVDGVITDPVAVGVSLASAAAVPVPTLGHWALVVLSLLMAGLSLGVLGRTHRAKS